jgi:hypothetical protein
MVEITIAAARRWVSISRTLVATASASMSGTEESTEIATVVRSHVVRGGAGELARRRDARIAVRKRPC